MTNEIKNVPELRFPEFKEGWSKLKLGELAEIVRGSSPRPISDPRWFDINSDIGWLRISDVTEQNGKITKLEQKISKDGQKKTRVLHSKHLLLSIAASVGKPVINYVKTGVHDGFLIFLKPLFDIEFMYQWLDAYRPKWKKYGQPGSQVNLNSELVKSQKIYMPHSVEQKKISDFFSKLDRQIELEEQKLAKLEEQKKGYMQKIFSQKIRFKDENGNNYPVWQENKLENIALKVKTKNFNNEYKETFTNSAEFGIVSQRDFFDKDISNEKNLTNYYIVEENDFVYNPRISNYAPVGPINRNKLGRTGIMSPLYTVFKVENINKLFLEYYFKTSQWHKFMKLNGDSGARSDRFTIKINIFMQMPIMMPAFEEQEKIGDFFSKIDNFIEKQSDKVELLKERKKGFLQKMFV